LDEDRLSPELGRLIDEAKAAARLLGVEAPAIEAVALLTESGDIYSGATLHYGEPVAPGPTGDGAGATPRSAAHLALERAQEAGAGEILAAAVTAPFSGSETAPPTPQSYERLAAIDPELPLIIKQYGRWVMLPASRVVPAS
jgi:hypothetical protein